MMDVMKRILQTAGTAGAILFSLVPHALAQAPDIGSDRKVIDCPGGQFSALCKLSAGNFGQLISTLITIAFVAAIVIALAFLIYGGFKWIVSGGEKGSLEEARNHIVASIVGLVIIFLSYFILNLVVFFFTGQGLTSITFPTITKLAP